MIIKLKESKIYGHEDSLTEDTVKKSNGKWTNRGKDGKEHGEFDTKKQADAQRKAMYANGYKGESLCEADDSEWNQKVIDTYIDKFTSVYTPDTHDSIYDKIKERSGEEIADAVLAYLEDDYKTWFDESLSEDFYPTLGGTPDYAKYKYDTRHKVKETASDEEIKQAVAGDKKAIKSLKSKGYYVNPLVNPLKAAEVGTFVVKDPDTFKEYTYDSTFSRDESLSEDLEDGTNDLEIVSNEVTKAEDSKDLDQEYSTPQAKILDELSYLISTEYEAVKWYDEAVPQIEASGLDEDLIISTVLGIEEIRKDEEDHIAHLERLVKQIKEGQLIDGTNGDE